MRQAQITHPIQTEAGYTLQHGCLTQVTGPVLGAGAREAVSEVKADTPVLARVAGALVDLSVAHQACKVGTVWRTKENSQSISKCS